MKNWTVLKKWKHCCYLEMGWRCTSFIPDCTNFLQSDNKHHCLLVIDEISRFNQMYPVTSIDTIHTTEDRATQKIVFDTKISFVSFDFSTVFPKLGITHILRIKCQLGEMRKLKYRTNFWTGISVNICVMMDRIGPFWLVNLPLVQYIF